MLGSAPPPDLSALLSYAATALLVLSGFLVLLRSAASRYFAVESPFGAGEEFERSSRTEAAPMSMVEEAEAREPQCVVCGDVGTKHCAGCKAVRYCSLDCQSKHWKEEHKSKCKRKVSGSAIALIPGNGPPARAAVKVLRMPKKILFPYEDFVRLFYWDKHVFPPCGLLNCGNSCFANVVLQCLSFTRPLAAYLLEGIHSRECRRKSRNNDWCFLCDIQSHIQKVNSSLQPFSPMSILSGLTNINSSLGYGRQEDAHEFMRFAIDTMQSVCLDEYGGEKSLDASTQETTLVHHVFGGHLQSQVICTSCNQVSNRYENMMDLTVEIQGDAESLEDCLDQFTAKEWLDGENKYKCDGCNDYVKALKCLTVHQAPNILTIALKRFQSGRFGKLNKRVTFPETLDLGPYMSSTGVNSNLYSLYAIVVHLDMLNASFFGHYICYTKDFRGQWYRIDDCKVVMVDIEEVLAQGAYMLLYNRMEVRRTKTLEAVEAKAPLGQFSSNFPPSDKIEKMEDTNACATSNDGTLIEVETNMDVVDVPQPSSKVLALTHAADEDFSVVKLESIKEQNLLPIGISANGNNNSTYSLLPLDQSDESKPLEHEVGSSNDPQEPVVQIARSDPQEPVVQIARSEGVEAGTTTCNLHPISPPGFLQLKQKRANSDVDSPCDAPSAPNLKNPATSPVSRGSSSSKESKPLFSRGFLDKPLKKKSLPLTRGARIERLTSSNGINGTSNGLCEPRQLDNETRKSDSQCSPRASNGSVKIATCSPRVSMGTNDHTEDGCSSEAIRCNGHLDANLSPFSHKKDVSTHTLALCTSVDEPHERHWTGNGFAEVDAVENRCASDANHENGSNSLPLEFMEGPTDIVLSENT